MSPVAGLKPSRSAAPFAFVDGLMHQLDLFAGKEGGKLVEPGGGLVFRAIVDADDLPHDIRQQRRHDHPADEFVDRLFLVVNGNDNRKCYRPGLVRFPANWLIHHCASVPTNRQTQPPNGWRPVAGIIAIEEPLGSEISCQLPVVSCQ